MSLPEFWTTWCALAAFAMRHRLASLLRFLLAMPRYYLLVVLAGLQAGVRVA